MVTIGIGNDNWEVCAHRHTPMGQHVDVSTADAWEFRPGHLPFDAISWLHDNGFGPDPVVEFNEHHYRWTEDVDWVLRKKFSLPAEFPQSDDEIQIELLDIDCFFDVFFNGHHLGNGRNQFRSHTFDVEETLLAEENDLIIYIRTARNVTNVMETAHGQLPAGFDTGRVHARRCQSLTGWDWTPRLSSVSVTTPPVFQTNPPISMANPFVYFAHLPPAQPGQSEVEGATATISVDIQSRRRGSGDLLFRITDLASGDIVVEKLETITIKPKPLQVRRNLEIPRAELWWPLGMGDQPMYSLEVILKATDRLERSYELRQQTNFGVRTVNVERQKDTIGESFIPHVNGVPVFCRGANWVPSTMLAAKASSLDYKTLISATIGAGMNCLRVWGGGIYERDEFYDLCDQCGILVWQDFMFTTAAYPTYRGFMDEVEAETMFQVNRLRNHPSLLLWCGNNENEWLHQTGDLKKGNEQKIIGETIWAHLIRQVVEEFDPSRIYHQSSPFGKNKADYNEQDSGDRHSWDSWAGWQHTDNYLLDHGRFISEVGLQSLPARESIAEFAPGADNVDNPALAHHQRMIEGHERLVRYMAAHYRLPNTLDEWISTSQAMQAEILRRAIENWRRNRFNTGGVLIWQLHDAYPAISWSLIDYYRRPKQAWYASRQFFSPVLLSMELLIDEKPASAIPIEQWHSALADTESTYPIAGGERMMCRRGQPSIKVNFSIINDTSVALSGNLVVEFLRSECEHLVLDTVAVTVEPNGSAQPLSHEINNALMQDITIMTVRANWQLDEISKTRLQEFGAKVTEKQRGLLGDSISGWLFDAEAGLSIRLPLVDPKYYQEPGCPSAGEHN